MELCCSSAPPVPFCTRNEIAATKAMIFDSQLHMDEHLVVVTGHYMNENANPPAMLGRIA